MSFRSGAIVVCVALAIAVALQITIIALDKSIGDEDAAAYALLAQNIRAGKGLSTNVVSFHFKSYPAVRHAEDYWPPLQSYLIALSTLLLGNSLFAQKLPNIIAFAALILCVYAFTARLFSRKSAVLAALMCLCAPDLVLYAIGCRNELVHIFLVLVALYCLATCVRSGKLDVKRAVVAGVAAGLSYLQRPVGVFLIATFVFWAGGVLLMSVKRKTVLPTKLRAGVTFAFVFVGVFSVVVMPYTVRNFALFGGPFPGLASCWSGIALEAYKHNPSARTVDSDLSHMLGQRDVYASIPKIDYRKDWGPFLRRGLSEIGLELLMFKRSLIPQITLLFLSVLSLFFVTGPARRLLSLFLIYAALNFVIVPFNQATEQRYFVFMIPFICIFAANMFFVLEQCVMTSGNRTLAHVRTKYWAFVGAFLLLVFFAPSVMFHANQFKRVKNEQPPFFEMATWIKEHTPDNATVMCVAPLRTAYYTQRPVVALPLASTEVIADLCRHYGVQCLLASQDEAARLDFEKMKTLLEDHTTRLQGPVSFVAWKFF